MDLKPRSHISNYFPPTSLSYRKLPTYADVHKHDLWLNPYSDASAKIRTTEKFCYHFIRIILFIRIVSQTSKNIVTPELRDPN